MIPPIGPKIGYDLIVMFSGGCLLDEEMEVLRVRNISWNINSQIVIFSFFYRLCLEPKKHKEIKYRGKVEEKKN